MSDNFDELWSSTLLTDEIIKDPEENSGDIPKEVAEERSISELLTEMCSLDSIGTFKNLLGTLRNGVNPDNKWEEDGLIQQNKKHREWIQNYERQIEENNARIELIDKLVSFLDAVKDVGVPFYDDWYKSYKPKTELSADDIKEIHFQMMRVIEDYAAFTQEDANTIKKDMSFGSYLQLRDQVLVEMASIHKRKDIYSYGCTHEIIQTNK